MASIFKQKYTVAGKDGERVRKQSRYWYIDYRAAEGIRKRVKGFKDKQATLQLAAKLEREAELEDAGVVDKFKEHRKRPLTEHLEGFRKSIGDDTKHAKHTENALKRVFEGCNFKKWGDLKASGFYNYISALRKSEGMSQRTFNFYLKAGKQFCKWMINDQRAEKSPLEHLKCVTVTRRERERRALSVDEICRLLESTEAQPRRFNLSGHERAFVYRLAMETGLRASEIRSLTVNSFDLDERTVTVKAENAKNKRAKCLPLRAETADEVKEFLAGKLPGVQVFNVPEKTAEMLKADLKPVGIEYQDEVGRYADFHSLRHTAGTLLAASGAHPKVAQSIMRHSDINLTMSLYTHTLKGQESEAVENLPDLSSASRESQRATGTDDTVDQSAYKPAYKKLAKKPYSGCDGVALIGTDKASGSGSNSVQGISRNPLPTTELDAKKEPVSSTDTGPNATGRWGIRTHDPLIKSQLLCQLS